LPLNTLSRDAKATRLAPHDRGYLQWKGGRHTMSSGLRIPNWISLTVRMGASECAREVAMMTRRGYAEKEAKMYANGND
jgi:hypothetical protein